MLIKTNSQRIFPRTTTVRTKGRRNLLLAAVSRWAIVMACTVLSVAGPTHAKSLPTTDLTVKYRVYVFGLPTWFDAKVDVDFEDDDVTMVSELQSWLVSNFHSTSFSFSDCDYQPQSYTNKGFSPGWKFDDSLHYDWANLAAQYRGFLQRPNQDEPVYQELEHELDDPNDAGFYVDKLTQFYVMGCHFGSNAHDDTLLLNYLDDTLGRYRVRIVKRGKKVRVADRSYATIEVQSEPYEATPGSIHRRVNYWLAPDLGYLPVLVKTKMGSMPLKVRLIDVRSTE